MIIKYIFCFLEDLVLLSHMYFIMFFEPSKLPEIPEDNDIYVVMCLHAFTKVFMEVGHLS